MMTVSVHEIGLFDDVLDDLLFLSLLSVIPMTVLTKTESTSMNTDALTIEFDVINNTLLMINVQMKTTWLHDGDMLIYICYMLVLCGYGHEEKSCK